MQEARSIIQLANQAVEKVRGTPPSPQETITDIIFLQSHRPSATLLYKTSKPSQGITTFVNILYKPDGQVDEIHVNTRKNDIRFERTVVLPSEL